MAERAVEEELARAAFERGSWSEAYELFRDLKPLDLPAEDWERYADASWWTGHIGGVDRYAAEGLQAYAEAGDDRRAGWMAARLCIEHFRRGEPAIAAGWFARTQRHVLFGGDRNPNPRNGSSQVLEEHRQGLRCGTAVWALPIWGLAGRHVRSSAVITAGFAPGVARSYALARRRDKEAAGWTSGCTSRCSPGTSRGSPSRR